VPKSLTALAICGLTATALSAGYPARESWIPVVGRATGVAGRGFYSTIHITDTTRRMNDVTLSFFPAAQPNVTPKAQTLQLGPGQSGAIEVGPQLTGDAGAVGALRIRASGPVIAEAFVYSRGANEPAGSEVGTVLNAIPVESAIGTGESTVLHVPDNGRYKIYAVETKGFPLYFSIRSDTIPTERRLYLGPHEQRSWDLAEIFPGSRISDLEIAGVNGSGKIIVAGTSITSQSQDFTAYEMSLPTRPRHRMPWPEAAAYVGAAIAIAAVALYRLKARATGNRQPAT
jgi:hypothetical protein